MHSLAPYSIRVFDRSLAGPADEKYHKLGNIRGKDLLKVLISFVNKKNDKYHEVDDGKQKKTLKFTNVKCENRTIYGIIEYGEYGVKGKVVNVTTGDTVYKKKKDDSDIHQLYFSFTVPSEESRGVCLFHNIHGRSVKGIVDTLINDFFREETKGLKIQLRPLTYEKAVEEWMKSSQVKELKLTNYSPKSDATDQVDKLIDNTSEIIYKPKKKGASFGSFWDFIKTKEHTGGNRQAVDILSQYCSNVKAVVEFDGRKRIFNLTSDSTPVSSIDFDESDVDMDDGAPNFKSLHLFAKSLIDDMLATI